MSFLKNVVSFVTGDSIGANIARTVALGYAVSRVSKSLNKSNDTDRDLGRTIQLNPSTENSIPVVYGSAFVGGSITDAVLTANNTTMWYCITICEKTGQKISDSQNSVISFNELYWNGYKVKLQSDGITIDSFSDPSGNVNNRVSGLIKFYLFSGDSDSPVKLSGEVNGNTQPAYNLFPGWTTDHQMNGLVFALVRMDYDKENDVTSIGNVEFKINNNMKLPGDCLFDYISNPIYGAGIDPTEIFDE
jgi:hypothetical protein